MKKILYFLFITTLVFLSACKDSQYVVRQTDKNLKYDYAYKWYMSKKYTEAIPVIENVMPQFKGTDTAANLYFMLADCYFLNKEYMVAAYHFKTFRDIYPKSYKSEVAAYKIAECYKNEIPRIELEQTDNEKAINYYRAFVSEFPNSPMVEPANAEIAKLNQNLEKKALLAADLYYKTANYRAAAVSYKNVIGQYPNIKQYEEIYYKIGLSYYRFAEQSIVSKQSERYEKAMDECQNFINRFPNSVHVLELNGIIEAAKIKILESTLRNANSHYDLTERPFHFNQSIELFNEYSPEIKNLPSSLSFYKDKCYLGIIKSYFYILDNEKDKNKRKERYNTFTENYYQLINKFDNKSEELREAEEIYKKVNQYYKS